MFRNILGLKYEIASSLVVLVCGIFYLQQTEVLFLADSYIFLKYAINLASGAGWSINLGEVSFGASSPLWTIMLAAYYKLYPHWEGFDKRAAMLGLFFYAAYVFVFSGVVKSIFKPLGAVVAITLVAGVPFCGFYLSLSAMETPLFLFCFVVLFSFVRTSFSHNKSLFAIWLGVLFGALYLVRIEGLAYLGSFVIVKCARGRRADFKFTAIVLLVFAAIIFPWHYFMYNAAQLFIPTSSRGRLYYYLSSVLPDVGIGQYQSAAIAERISWLPTIFYTQFVQHLVVLIFCVLPFIAIVAAKVIVNRHQYNSLDRQVINYLLLGVSTNFGLYLFFQPLIFQRYLIAFFPSSLIAAGVLSGDCRFESSFIKKTAKCCLFSCVILMHCVGFFYYIQPIKRDYETIAMLKKFSQGEDARNCRLAAEPMGLAAYFTPCYIIDLGGLINPDARIFWKEFEKNKNQNDGELRDVEYALTKNATHVLWNGVIPEKYAPWLKPNITNSLGQTIYKIIKD